MLTSTAFGGLVSMLINFYQWYVKSKHDSDEEERKRLYNDVKYYHTKFRDDENEIDRELSTYSTTLAIAGAIGGLASAGTASAIGAIGSAYFSKIRSDLNYMNNTHPHNYLYMDVNIAGFYTIAVL